MGAARLRGPLSCGGNATGRQAREQRRHTNASASRAILTGRAACVVWGLACAGGGDAAGDCVAALRADVARAGTAAHCDGERSDAPAGRSATRRSPPRTPRREVEPQEQSAPAPAPTALPSSEPVMITTPTWIERPRHPERWFPRQAFMQGIAGEVVLDCEVSVDGRLSCVVASETPTGQGFGDAALRIAQAHVMRPAMQNGVAVRGRYRMVVPFTPNG
ncbi:MAG: TonB family protein [Caulobacteraceae bacterium]|nr:TonB family protein [Caulobacteraceae bacterium]